MAKRYADVPKWNDGTSFEDFANDIEIWEMTVEGILKPEQLAGVVYLSLSDAVREKVRALKAKDMKHEKGLEVLMKKLKALYGKHEKLLKFLTYERFDTFIRPKEMNIIEYLNEWEARNDKCKSLNVQITDDTVLAYLLLKSANLNESQQTLIRTTLSDYTLAEMNEKIRAMCNQMHSAEKTDRSTGPSDLLGDDNTLPIKVEPVQYAESSHILYTRNSESSQQKVYSGKALNRGNRGNHRGNYRGNYSQAHRGNNRKTLVRNPPDRNGETMKCHICKAETHMVNDCPDRGYDIVDYQRSYSRYNANNLTLFEQGIDTNYLDVFLEETLNCGVLDSGCPDNVCGNDWLNHYIDNLDHIKQKEVRWEQSCKTFKFGGDVYESLGVAEIPAKLGSKSINIRTDVISLKIPLLMSSRAMKKAQTQIDFAKDSCVMLGEKMNLRFTSSGHYAVCLMKEKAVWAASRVLIALKSLDDKKKAAKKLHEQFAHASSKRIIDLLRDEGTDDSELFDSIRSCEDNCETCKLYKKSKPRPAVGFSLSKNLNDVVCIDLKFFDGKICLHLVDHATRFSAAAIVESKRKEEIVDKMFRHWISLFGVPRKIQSDNGGEFSNILLIEMCEFIGSEPLCTAAESPWSNSIVERHNAVIGLMVKKVLHDVNCSLEVALAWSVAAKNALKNVYGYSPNQLVFGRNPNLPVAVDSEPPALEGVTASKIIADHLNAMHIARQAFIQSEASDKIKRALTRNVRTATVLPYDTGDKVYYRTHGNDKMHGPAIVIGKANKQVYIKHGGFVHRVNPIHLQLVDKKQIETKELAVQDPESEGSSTGVGQMLKQNEVDNSTTVSNETISEEVPTQSSESISTVDNQSSKNCHTALPDVGSIIKYKMSNFDEFHDAKVLSRAGKASTNKRTWLNIDDYDAGKKMSLNFADVESWNYYEESNESNDNCNEVLLVSEGNEVHAAKMKEIENLKEHAVYRNVEYTGQSLVHSRWILTEKIKNGEKTVKA